MIRGFISVVGLTLACVGFSQSKNIIAVRLDPGDDVLVVLRKLAKDHQIRAGVILTGVGSFSEFTVRYAAKPDTFPMKGNFEVVSFAGTFGTAGEHIHFSFADKEGKMSGGHLMPVACKVDKTFELVVQKVDGWKFERKPGPVKGMKVLDAKKVNRNKKT